ncbi:MAG: Stk1 family PASTA domain-containing Ser/Thr kinase [Liquorilactobacillus ghanensis]|uniref:Stk1 family PASTA domain-containing Ser/Thr kinase n=1 Tax=Liquorilactobacillus ghanensis TaxID=399370 RepID=UPI0039EC9C36
MRAGYVLSGRYQIKQTLGEGGMANVYLAQDLILQRPVAVKLMRLDLRDDPAAVRRFQREAISLTELTHPNIVSIYDVGEDNGMQYLIMEYVEGTDLKAYIQQNFPLAFPTVVAIMEQILAAVDHAHNHGIIHRDLKPQNILINHEGQVKITDFGIALATTDSLTQTNTLMGSVHYLSPEQARGSVVTKQSDIYSLGIILFELLTKRVPFQGETAVSIALKHYKDEMPAVRQFNPEIPQALENVILHATAKNLTDRYQSAAEMAADLKTALSPQRAAEAPWHPQQLLDDETKVLEPLKESETKQAAVKKTPTPKKKWSKKKKWLVIGASFAGFLLVLGLIGFAVAPRSVKVPDLQGMTKGEAVAVLQQQQLTVGKTRYRTSGKYYKGQIVQTEPAAGSSVRQKSKVALILSSGPEKRKFGNYRGQSFNKVKKRLEKKGVTVLKTEKHSKTIATGEIMAQSIDPKRKVVWRDSTVTFTVSTGATAIKLRDLTGYTRKSVIDYANELGLVLQSNWQAGSEKTASDADLVVAQTPAAGTLVQSGGILTVTFAASTTDAASTSSTSAAESSSSSASSSSTDSSSSTASSANQFKMDITIPYNEPAANSADSSAPAQQVQIYLADDNHSLDQVYQTLSITKDTKVTLPFSLSNSATGKYKVVANGKTIAENDNVTSGN